MQGAKATRAQGYFCPFALLYVRVDGDSFDRTKLIMFWATISVIAELTFTHRQKIVRGDRTGSNNSGVEDNLRGK